MRGMILEGLEDIGMELDAEKNGAVRGRAGEISTGASKTKLLVIPTDEEKMIAEDTMEIARSLVENERGAS